MKILFFIDSLTSGGKERRLTELLKALNPDPRMELKLVVMSEDIFYREIMNMDLKIEYLLRKSKKDVLVFVKFFKLCAKFKPDIVHCWDSMTAIYSVPACKILGIKLINGMVVDTLVNPNIFNRLWRRARFTFPFSDAVVGNSHAGLISYKAPAKKSVCIYNGMNLNRFKNLKNPALIKKEIFGNIPEDTFIAGMVAGFEARKDYRTLIQAAIMLLSEDINIRFVLVGDGSDLESMRLIVPGELTEKIKFLGRRNNVESIINIFDTGILITNAKVHGEGISNSIIEYMALGKPVIATKGGGTNEIVKDGINGFLINPGEPAELCAKIKKLIQNKELKNSLGEAGILTVRENFVFVHM